MTSLFDAYGGGESEVIDNQEPKQKNNIEHQEQFQQPPQQLPQQHQQSPPIQHQHQQQTKEQFNNYCIQQPQPQLQQIQYTKNYNYSFLDRMALSRSDVIKLTVFALVIVLGISIDRFITYYLTRYITDNVLSTLQEVIMRLTYPVLIFLIIWIFKSL